MTWNTCQTGCTRLTKTKPASAWALKRSRLRDRPPLAGARRLRRFSFRLPARVILVKTFVIGARGEPRVAKFDLAAKKLWVMISPAGEGRAAEAAVKFARHETEVSRSFAEKQSLRALRIATGPAMPVSGR